MDGQDDYMRTIKTSDGKTFEIKFCGVLQLYLTRALYIEFIGETIVDMVNQFSDESANAVLYSYVDGEPHKTFIGFTNLTEAGITGDNVYVKLETPIPQNNTPMEEEQG